MTNKNTFSHSLLGEILIKKNWISQDAFEKALIDSKRMGIKIGVYLLKENLIDSERLARALAEQAHIPFFDLKQISSIQIKKDIFSENVARRNKMILVQWSEKLYLCMSNAQDTQALSEASKRLGSLPFTPCFSDEKLVDQLLQKLYPTSQINKLSQATLADIQTETKAQSSLEIESSVSQLVQHLIEEASFKRASDIHIEPRKDCLAIRLRIDGNMTNFELQSVEMAQPLLQSIKMKAGLVITESKIPQDGSIKFIISNKEIHTRISTTPTAYGESCVLRLLSDSEKLPKLNELGLNEEELTRFQSVLSADDGLILLTGPTGAGKSTTLYASLNYLNEEFSEKKLFSIENPIEMKIDGVTQSEVNEKQNYNFSTSLKTALRQDPDVIMLGEIRDLATAEAVLNAASTGHLVLSTLHVSKAKGAPSRLKAMGVKDMDLVTDNLKLVMNQRLIGKICPHCKEKSELTQTQKHWATHVLGERVQFQAFEGKGCSHCQNGTIGRQLVQECLFIDHPLKMALLNDEKGQYEQLCQEQLQERSLAYKAATLACQGIIRWKDALAIDPTLAY